MREFVLDTRFHDTAKAGEGEKRVVLLSLEEFRQVGELPHKRSLLHHLEQGAFCKAELFGPCILGVVSIPMKKERVEGRFRLGFYLRESVLYLVGEEEMLVRLVGRMRENHFPEELTLAGFFCALLNSWVEDDMTFLQRIEDGLSGLEELLLREKLPENFYQAVIPRRKDLTAMHTYYNQLTGMGIALRANTDKLLTEEDCLMYGYFAERAERLHNYVEMLREYTLQLREMYQTKIAEKQNKTMNLLTVLSAVFLPLTLVAGWYGMNFINMPELQWVGGYPAVILISIVVVIVEIIIFKKKDLM